MYLQPGKANFQGCRQWIKARISMVILVIPRQYFIFQEVNHNKIAKSIDQHKNVFTILTMHTEHSFMCSVK